MMHPQKMLRSSRRRAGLAPTHSGIEFTRRKRYKVEVDVQVYHHASGGNVPNYLGERILDVDPSKVRDGGTLTIESEFWRKTKLFDFVTQRQVDFPNGQGYFAVNHDTFLPTLFKSVGAYSLRDAAIQEMVQKHFKTTHAYNWTRSTRLVIKAVRLVEVNANNTLKKGRKVRHLPMLSALPLRMPYLPQHLAAVSLQAADGNELCVPWAVCCWLKEWSKSQVNGSALFIPTAAVAKYPQLAKPKRYPSEPPPKKGKPVDYESIKELLDCIHKDLHEAQRREYFFDELATKVHVESVNGKRTVMGSPLCYDDIISAMESYAQPPDVGHTTSDVQELIRLFGKQMYAFTKDGVCCAEVIGANSHYPFIYYQSHEHMYWVCEKKDVERMAKSARNTRMAGCKHFVANGAVLHDEVVKDKPDMLLLTEKEVTQALLKELEKEGKATNIIVKGAKNVEKLLFEVGYLFGEPCRVRASKKVNRFSVVIGETGDKKTKVYATITADPFYEQTLIAAKDGDEFDHTILLDACEKQGIDVDALDGLGKIVLSFFKPVRHKTSEEERKQLFEEQKKRCAYFDLCGHTFQSHKCGNADHITPLANGGNDRVGNKQLLCTECHSAKTEIESERKYNSELTHSSRYNAFALEKVMSPLHTYLEFCESWWPFPGLAVRLHDGRDGIVLNKVDKEAAYVVRVSVADVATVETVPTVHMKWRRNDDLVEHPSATKGFKHAVKQSAVSIHALDMVRCRKHILLFPDEEWGVYTALDQFSTFSGILKAGSRYLVESDNWFPLQGSGIYDRATVQYALDEGIIQPHHILREFVPSVTLPKDYFADKVERLESIDAPEKLKKMLPNSYVGLMGRKQKEVEFVKMSFSEAEAAGMVKYNVTGFEATVELAHTFPGEHDYAGRKVWKTRFHCTTVQDVFALSIYESIKMQEARECHKLCKLLQTANCLPLAIKTDCIIFARANPTDDMMQHHLTNSTESAIDFIQHSKLAEDTLVPGLFWHGGIQKWKVEDIYASDGHLKLPAAERVPYPRTLSSDDRRLPHIEWKSIGDDVLGQPPEAIIEKAVGNKFLPGAVLHGRPGTGKSWCTRFGIDVAEKEFGEEANLKLAPTNIAALNINGTTIHKFFTKFDTAVKSGGKARANMQTRMNKLRIVWVDEMSQLHSWWWGALSNLKTIFPHLRFFIVGDFNQFDPVKDLSEGLPYAWNHALFHLVGGNHFELKLCRRSDVEFFNFCENVDAVDIRGFVPNAPTDLNIVRSHYMRRRINDLRQQEWMRRAEDKSPIIAADGWKLAQAQKNKEGRGSQDVQLCVDYPLVSRKNVGEGQAARQLKNQFFVVTAIDVECEEGKDKRGFTAKRVLFEHEDPATLTSEFNVPYTSFHHLFEPGFAITAHGSQCMSLENYTIWEWDKMDTKSRYVSLTRSKSKDAVFIA